MVRRNIEQQIAKLPVGRTLHSSEPKSKPQVAQVSPPASSALPIVPATPLMSMDSFIQQATQALRQIEASHAAAGVPPPAIAQVAAPNHSHTGRWWPASANTIIITAIHQTFGYHFHHACQLLSSLPLGVRNSG